MSIVDMKRVTVVSPNAEAPSCLEALQTLGLMHLVPLVHPDRVGQDDRSSGASKEGREALRYLLSAPRRRWPTSFEEGFDFRAVVHQALENRRRRRDCQDRVDRLQERLRFVEPWGEFAFPPLSDLAGIRLWFYVVPLYQLRKMKPDSRPWQIVHQDRRYAYVVLLSEDEPPLEAMPVVRSRVGSRSLGELRRELEQAQSEMEDLQGQRWSLTRWTGLLSRNLGRADDAAARLRAREEGLEARGLFAVQGWVPAPDLDRLTVAVEHRGWAVTASDPSHHDEPPVLLANPPAWAPGENLVGFYQVPGYRDWDPSAFVYLTFVLFFAMILADAGYGVLLGAGLGLGWRRLGKTESSRRFRRLLLSITGVSVIYGVLIGSYFGTSPPSGSLWETFRLLDASDFGSMMPLSIGVGILHLVVANLVTAWSRRRRAEALAPIGWSLGLVGGYGLYLEESIGFPLMVLGGILIFLFSSRRRGWGPKTLVLRLVDGLTALTGVSKAFGDVLSYLRLFALGLSSASLAATFNQLGSDLMGAGRGLTLVLGVVVLLLGHTLNFVLGLVGGVVHGLRLNVIELYNWSVFGEGKPFRPFARSGLHDLPPER